MNFSQILEPPSLAHWCGTDSLGRDLLARLAEGSFVSLGVSLSAVLIALFFGVIIGSVAGYRGGAWDKSLMALVDMTLCFPAFFLILAVMAFLGPSMWNVVLVIGFTGWPGTARLVRAEILSLKEREFILAARSLGIPGFRIVWRHLLPNALGPVAVNAVLGVSAAILTESGLSFLGIGVQPPMASWGNILTEGKMTLGYAWWLTFFPGLAIFLTVLGMNYLGEKLSQSWRAIK